MSTSLDGKIYKLNTDATIDTASYNVNFVVNPTSSTNTSYGQKIVVDASHNIGYAKSSTAIPTPVDVKTGDALYVTNSSSNVTLSDIPLTITTTATINYTVTSGYALTVSCTNATYSASNGVLTITKTASGAVTVAISASEIVTYTVTIEGTHCSASSTTIQTGESKNITFTVDSGYELKDTGITVTGATKGALTSNVLTISNPTENVVITAEASQASAGPFCITTNVADTSIKLLTKGTPSYANTEYSLDGTTWTTYTMNTYINLPNIGDKIYFKNTITGALSSSNYLRFATYNPSGKTMNVSLSGNIMSMYNSTDYENITSLSYNYCFTYLFWKISAYIDASNLQLPATVLSQNCYYYMFAESNITVAPELPATTLAKGCYNRMFYSCKYLTNAPKLPAMSIEPGSYVSMFSDCSSLTSIPLLPATELKTYGSPTSNYNHYSNMFSGCTQIKMSESQTGEYTNEYTFGVIPSGYQQANMMFSGTGGTFTGTPTAQTYYTSNTIVS